MGAACAKRAPEQPQDQDAIRKARLAKLTAPGDLDDSWKNCFLDTGLAASLRTWRSSPFPDGSLLMLLLEGSDDDIHTKRCQMYLWPKVASGLLSRSPAAGEVLATRLQFDKAAPAKAKPGSRESDASMLIRIFGLKRDGIQLPTVFFLYGATPVRAYHFGEHVAPSSFIDLLESVRGDMKKHWQSIGWNEISKSRIKDVTYLESLSKCQELHRKQAEELLGALSALQAGDLMRKSGFTPGDFVVEDVGVSLDADAAAEAMRAEHIMEQEERAALRASQQAEFEEAEADDAQRREAESKRSAEERKLAEEREAADVWAMMDRQHRLENLPIEPSESDAMQAESNVMNLTVVLPGGRKLTRRWLATDPVSAVADFAFGHAEESELPYQRGLPTIVCNFPKREVQPGDEATLAGLGLATKEILRAVVPEQGG